jgi:DNA-3-methyladenine glycosylase II
MPLTREETNRRRKLRRHIDAIAREDADVARALDQVGYPLPRCRPAGFETFLRVIVSQQISTSAANAIWGRVVDALPSVDANGLLDCNADKLRGAGLSARKVEYARGLAEAITCGELDPGGLDALEDEHAIEQITALRGFGRWSAEIYLMFSLGRGDIFPADDLALQVGLQRLKGLSDKPTPKRARELIEAWSPRRSAGSLFLWHYYQGAPA